MLGGELVHQTSDEYGSIEVIDYLQKIRALHFGNMTQQSASLLCNPFFLVHKYAQAMTLPLCWLKPQRVLVLGLGAGSMVRYLYNYFPNLVIDAVELRPKVTEVAIEYFMLPEPDERFNIYHESAESWLKKENHNQYDLIIVDVFLTSDTGKDITVDLATSFNYLSNMLNNSGVAVLNHLGADAHSYPGFNVLSDIFEQRISTINIGSTNSIILTSKTDIPETLSDEVFDRMANTVTVPYPQYFDLMQVVSR